MAACVCPIFHDVPASLSENQLAERHKLSRAITGNDVKGKTNASKESLHNASNASKGLVVTFFKNRLKVIGGQVASYEK